MRGSVVALGQESVFKRSDLFGGQGEVKLWNLLGAERASPFTAALWCELEPGGSVGVHQQQTDVELVICISGDGQAAVDGQMRPLGQGSLLYLPLGATLALENRSSRDPLRYLIIKGKTD